MKNARQWSVTLIATFLLGAARQAGADHHDGLDVLTHPSASLNDAYAFRDPVNAGMVVLAMTVNGNTPGGINPAFGPDCLYQFKIDNTGDFVEDLVIQIRFDKPTGSGFAPTQNFTVVGPIKPTRKGAVNSVSTSRQAPVITGPVVNLPVTGVPANTFTTAPNGMKIFCGLRDDAFTFDEIFIRNILRGTLAAPSPANTRNPGIDFYAKANCSTIVIEMPSAMLTGPLVNAIGNNELKIWATTSLPTSVTRSQRIPAKGEPPVGREVDAKKFVQVDRVALPCVSTFLINAEDKNAFGAGQPKDDVKFFLEAAKPLIQKLQLDSGSVASQTALANLLAIRFPDVLSLDVTSTNGFDSVEFSDAVPLPGNGRRPQDDVVSFELGLITVGVVTNEGIPGSNGRVGGNDATFIGGSSTTIGTFPFFAPPHVPAEPVPARN